MSQAAVMTEGHRRMKPASLKPVLGPRLTILASVAILLIFVFWIGPWGLETATMKPVADTIEEYGIEANAYYYTEVSQFSDAQVFFSNNRRFSHE